MNSTESGLLNPGRRAQGRMPALPGGRTCLPTRGLRQRLGLCREVEVIRDPEHDVHVGMLEWLGGQFDTEHFDPKQATRT